MGLQIVEQHSRPERQRYVVACAVVAGVLAGAGFHGKAVGETWFPFSA